MHKKKKIILWNMPGFFKVKEMIQENAQHV